MKRRAVGVVRAARTIRRSTSELRKIQTSKAKIHLSQVLRDVARGESLIITRHGRQIARIVPELDRFQAEIDRALEGIPGAGSGR
jgi:prevent-host-death family protein